MYLLPIGQPGGGPETLRLLARELDRERFDVSVVCPDSPIMDRLAEIPNVRRFTERFPSIPTPRAVGRLAVLMRSERPDIVHSHLFHGDLYGFLATRFAPVPILVSTVQGVNFFWELERFPRRAKWWLASLLYRAIYRVFAGIATCSSAVKEAMCSRPGVKVRPDLVRVIHNAIDDAEPGADPPRPVGAATKRIVTVASLEPCKGHDVLLEALRRVAADIPVQCLLVGDGPSRPSLQATVRSLGLGDMVRFLGYQEAVTTIVRECDVFVLPSLLEGFGIAVVEAMALGVPVVASATGGIPEIITDGEDGLLVPPGDSSALAAAIRRLLTDDALREAIVGRARERAKRFTASVMAEQYREWYEELLSRKGLSFVS
jgi:glycosyltransferase involved in cell wall biosynthesis